MIKRSRYRGTIAGAQTKQEAKDAEAAVRREVFEGTYGKPKGDGSFIEYAEQVFLPWSESNKRSWRSDQTKVAVFNQSFAGKSFREITPMLIEKFKRARLQTATPSGRPRRVASVNRELAYISKIFSLAIRDGKTGSNPCRQVQKYEEHNERNRYLTQEEEDRLLSEMSGARAHLKAVVQIAINTGMRRGEILGLRWSWIDFIRGFIHLPSEATKTAKPRSIPMNQLVRALLTDIRETRESSEFVFASPKTSGSLTDIKHGFVSACEDAKVIDFKFHDLRHTAATRLADAGADPFVIAEILGHSDLRMTKRYTHATDERKRQALERLAQFSNRKQFSRKQEKRAAAQTNCHKIVTMKERKVG